MGIDTQNEKLETGFGCTTARLLRSLKRRIKGDFATSAQSALDSDVDAEAPGSYCCDCTLAQLDPGQCGTILRLLGNSQGRLRLLEMGMTPGTHLKVLRRAAFGGPLDVYVRGYHLSLRSEEAALIWLGEDEAKIPLR